METLTVKKLGVDKLENHWTYYSGGKVSQVTPQNFGQPLYFLFTYTF